jgi:hypothetical protein
MRNLLAIGGLALTLAATTLGTSAQADAGIAPPSDNITIDLVTVNGSGCPLGSAWALTTPDKTGFKVFYSKYLAEAGPGIEATAERKNCQINLLVHVPQGYSYAIAKAEYIGYANLSAGVTGIQDANYYFMGDSASTMVTHKINGPLNGIWKSTEIASALVYSPCGAERNLNINSSLRVDAGNVKLNSPNMIAMFASSGDVWTLFNFSWRTC